MGKLNYIVASDIHEGVFDSDESTESFPHYRHIRDVANFRKSDAAFFHGDFFDENLEVLPVMRVKHLASARMNRWTDAYDHGLVELYSGLKQHGGLDGIKLALDSGLVQGSQKKELENFLKLASGKESELERIHDKYKGIFAFNERWTDADVNDLKKELVEEHKYKFQVLDKIFGEFKCPVYAVRGNWDSDLFMDYNWKNLKFLEKTGIVNLKGVKFAGVPDWYEALSGLDGFFDSMEKDTFMGGNRGGLSQELESQITQEDLVYLQHGLLPPRFLENNVVFNRLKNKPMDVLITHKGPHNMAGEGDKNYGWGVGLEALIQRHKPKVIVGGHIHGKSRVFNQRLTEDYAYGGLHTTDEEFFEVEQDTGSKEVISLDKYRWPEQVVYRKAA